MYKRQTTVFRLPCVVAINRFPLDTEAELALIADRCRELGVHVALSEVWAKGGEGGRALAEEVVRLCEQPNQFQQAYPCLLYTSGHESGGPDLPGLSLFWSDAHGEGPQGD